MPGASKRLDPLGKLPPEHREQAIELLKARRRKPRAEVSLSAVEVFRAAIGEPDPWQAALLENKETRVILNCARRSGKSATVAVLALHHALVTPSSEVLIVGPCLRQPQELYRMI